MCFNSAFLMKYFYGRYLEVVSDKADPSTRIIYILVISSVVSNRVNDNILFNRSAQEEEFVTFRIVKDSMCPCEEAWTTDCHFITPVYDTEEDRKQVLKEFP